MSTGNILEGPEEDSGIPHQSLGKLLLEALNSSGRNNLAVIDLKSGECYTYGDLITFSQNLSSSLAELGIGKGVIIGLVSENSHKFCVALLASFYLAAPVHLINPGYTEYELKHILALSKPRLLFCSKKSLNNLMRIKNHFHCIHTIVLFEDDDEGIEGLILYKNLIKKSTSVRIEEDIDTKTQTAIICNSSGTTGLPKGVMLTHANLRMHFVYSRTVFHMKPTEIIQTITPLFHIYSIHIFNAALYSGSTLLLLDRFGPKQFLENIEKYRLEQLFLVPSLINFLANSSLIKQYDLSSIRYICSTGAPLLEEDWALLKIKFKLETVEMLYGMTEATGLVVSTSRDQPTPKGSCGKVAMGCQLKIVDRETNQDLNECSVGEICVKGPNLMKGYINDAEKTQEIIDRDGFLHSGDLGYYDEQGFLFVVGRIKDMICHKAFQVSPVEIENVLLTHPSVKEAAVVGKPDRRAGEVAVGFVVKREGATLSEEEIAEYLSKFVCVEKRLHGGVRFVEAIPKNSTGKILRYQLQQMLQ